MQDLFATAHADLSAALLISELPTRGSRTGVTRRAFLWWSAALGASAALPFISRPDRKLRLAFIGLGDRGQAALAACGGWPGIEIAALCDLSRDRLRAAARVAAGGAAKLQIEPPQLLYGDGRSAIDAIGAKGVTATMKDVMSARGATGAIGAVDACILAAAGRDQLALAAAACAAGKDVFLLRPFAFDLERLRTLSLAAGQAGRQIHIARATRVALTPRAARRLARAGPPQPAAALVRMELSGPTRPDRASLDAATLDEIDFACEMLQGRPIRLSRIGGPAVRPGCWNDERLRFELTGKPQGTRWLDVAILAKQAAVAGKHSEIILSDGRATVLLGTEAISLLDPTDLALFLGAVRGREAGLSLSLARLLEIMADGTDPGGPSAEEA